MANGKNYFSNQTNKEDKKYKERALKYKNILKARD